MFLNLIAAAALAVVSAQQPTPLTAEEKFSVLEEMYKSKAIEAEYFKAAEAAARARLEGDAQNKVIADLVEKLRQKHNAAGHDLGKEMKWVKPTTARE